MRRKSAESSGLLKVPLIGGQPGGLGHYFRTFNDALVDSSFSKSSAVRFAGLAVNTSGIELSPLICRVSAYACFDEVIASNTH